MKDDERALLAAVVADPADDTVRLAYADCVEDRGNAARAAFIRLQIEAGGLHPNSNARAALEQQAEALFAEHWIDWWGEVCATVGLPLPAPKPTSRLGRIARRVRLATPAGEPYRRSGYYLHPRSRASIDGWSSATFGGGFPDAVAVEIPLHNYSLVRSTLELWASVSPLAALTATGPLFLIHGPYLAGIKHLGLSRCDPEEWSLNLGAPHLDGIRGFAIHTADDQTVPDDELRRVMAHPRLKQLNWLTIPVPTLRAAEIVADAPNIRGLETLHVALEPLFRTFPLRQPDPGPSGRLSILARSPHLAGLRELSVSGILYPDDARAVTRSPTWVKLRSLAVHPVELAVEAYPALLDGATLPELETLSVGLPFTRDLIDLLVRSPLLKHLRHLVLGVFNEGGASAADFRRLAGIVDPERIESLALGLLRRRPGVDELQRRLGDRLRLYFVRG